MSLQLDIVTIEGRTYSQEVDTVVAPGSNGEMGILPNHAPLLTSLDTGVLRIKRGLREELYAVAGGYMEVLPDRVTVLADTVERADDIDLERAQAARDKAQEILLARSGDSDVKDFSQAEAALRRAMIRIRVAQTQRRRRGSVRENRSGQN